MEKKGKRNFIESRTKKKNKLNKAGKARSADKKVEKKKKLT